MTRIDGGDIAAWLHFAASPSFAAMALLAAFDGPMDTLCGGMHLSSPLSGMAPMYLLMSVFHAAPWLKRIAAAKPRWRLS